MSFLGEIKRRKVFQIAAVYLVVAWLIVQVIDVVGDPLGLPDWFATTVIVALAIGFPISVILTWAFEITPDGVVREEGSVVHRGRTIEYVLIGLLAVALIFVIFSDSVPNRRDPFIGLVDVSEPVPGFSDRAAIAVLPFVNLSGDSGQEYFSDGISQEIITELHSIGTFPVIASTSTFTYKGSGMDVPEIAAELGAGYVLAGDVRRIDDQVRITPYLSDASGVQIWRNTYDFRFDNILAVQDEIAQSLIGAIEPELLNSEIDRAGRVRTGDEEAWDYYLQAAANATSLGGSFADRNGQPVTLERTTLALELARRAIDLDEQFAEAYTMLGHILVTYSRQLREQVGREFAERTLQEAVENARKGFELNPYSATTCSCYAALLAWDGPEAELDIHTALNIQEEAVRLNPSNAFARSMLAQVYQVHGRYTQALEEVRVAKRLSPRDVNFSHFLSVEALTHLSLGDWASAERLAQSAITLRPFNYYAHVTRTLALYAAADLGGAEIAANELLESIPDFSAEMVWNMPLPESLTPIASALDEGESITRYQEIIALILKELT